MPLKLISPGGGSVILSAPSTGSTYTLTTPALSANLISDGDTGTVSTSMLANNGITTSKIADSGITASKMGYSGAALQYLQWVYNSVYEISSSTEFDLPSLLGDGTANITLTNSANRILFKAGMLCGQEDTWRGNLFRTYYSIGGGSWTQVTNGGFASIVYTAGTHGNAGMVTHEYLLPTLSTSLNVRFKVTSQGHASGNSLHLNQNNVTNDSTARNTVQGCSYIILQEIKA